MRKLITRRRALATIGLTAAASASAVAIAAVPVPESAELHRLIEASRKAEAKWDAAADLADAGRHGPDAAALDAEAKRLLALCDPALCALLAYPVASMGELRTMVAHLREPTLGPWGCEVRIEPKHVEVFLDTLLAGTPAGSPAPCPAVSPAAAPVDAMLDFVGRYRAALRDFDAARPHTDESCDAFCAERINPLCDEARDTAPATTSERGATEGIRLALFLIEGNDDDTGCALLTSALAFLDGRAA